MVLTETGVAPKMVKRDGNRIRIIPRDDRHRTTIKALYDRQRLEGGHIITITPDICELTGEGLNEEMIRWLRVEQ
jgi:hypothetical protein